jgi:hypothetical protein
VITDSHRKKEIQAAYKERTVTGGVYAIRNTATGKALIDVTADMRGMANRFAFMKKTGSCVNPKLQADWIADAPPFAFEILEELKKDRAKPDAEFKADLALLKELWLEKMGGADLYN